KGNEKEGWQSGWVLWVQAEGPVFKSWFVVGLSGEEHGVSCGSGGVEQEVGKRGRIAWWEKRVECYSSQF
nr:hypothetical protein [Tanacetum cinerariifolium]